MRSVKNLTLKFYVAVSFYFIISCTLGALLATGVIFKLLPFGMYGLAHAHLAVVGFVSLVIVGSMYQIVPVLLGTSLDSESLGNLQFWIMNFGVLGMVGGFWVSNLSLVGFFGVVVAFSLVLFSFIIYRTMQNRSVGIGLTMKFFIAAIVYVLVASLFGIMIAFGVLPGFLGGYSGLAHAHLALFGWVTLTIMGAMYQMFPMLSLKELYSERLGEIQFWMSNVGVVGLILSLVSGNGIQSVLFRFFAVVLVGSVFLFSFIIFMTLFSGGRRPEKMDITVKYYTVAVVYISLSCLMGVLMSLFPSLLFMGRVVLAHVHLAVVGWVSITIVGAMYHLVPMLVWTEKYASRMGTEKVPTIKDLYSEKVGMAIFWMFNVGVVGLVVSLLASLQIGITVFSVLLLIASFHFSFDMLRIILRTD